MNTLNPNTLNPNTLLRRTGTLALAAALLVLGSQAGHCGDINPQPLPPCHHAADVIHLLIRFLLARF